MPATSPDATFTKLTDQRAKREKNFRQLCEDDTLLPRERLSLLHRVLNSLIDEHNATTEPEGRISDTRHVQAHPKDLVAIDAWWHGGDIMDLLSHFSPRVPYDPMLLCGCLPQRPNRS